MMKIKLQAFWKDIISQNRAALPAYFCEHAVIRWPCTNEQFTVAEYIQANCAYPGAWKGEIERLEEFATGLVLVGRVQSLDESVSCHVTSFITLEGGKVVSMDEYWADDGEVPLWRQKLRLGKPIK